MEHLDQPELPGFDPSDIRSYDSGLRAAALATIDALRADGVLGPRHALHAQLLLATAARAGIGLQAQKTTIATTNLLRLLTELLDELPGGDETVADAAAQFLAAIDQADQDARDQAARAQ